MARGPASGQNPMYNLPGLTTVAYKGSTWLASPGGGCPPHRGPGVQPVHCSLARELLSRTLLPWPALLFYVSAFLTQALPFRGLFIQALPTETFFGHLWGRGCLKTLLSTLTQESAPFHTYPCLLQVLSLSLLFRATKWRESFVQGFLGEETAPPPVCDVTSHPRPVLCCRGSFPVASTPSESD